MSDDARTPRRVLLLIDEYQGEDGGTEGQVATLVRTLPAPWTCELWALRNAPWFETGRLPCPTRVVGLAGIRNPLFLRSLNRIARAIRAGGFDLVHAFMADGAVYGPLIADRAGVPVITSRRDLGYWQTPRKLDVLRIANRSADLVIANAAAVRDRTVEVEWVPPAKVAVVPNGHSPARFDVAPDASVREALGVPADARLVGLVANFRPLKRQPDLVDALARLGDGFEDVHVLFLGDYDDGEVRARADALGVAPRVHVHRPGSDVVPILAALDVGALCSESEGLSNAVIEYMAMGLPVVASAVGGTPDLVVQDETGCLYPAGDVDALAAALARVLGDPDRALAMGRAGRARFEARYTAERMAAATVACYERVLTGRAKDAEETLQVEVIERVDELAPLRAGWDALLADDQLFLSPTWVLTWLEATGSTPCVAVARGPDGSLVGLLPLTSDGATASFCGRELGADHLDVIAAPPDARRVARACLDALREHGLKRLRLDHLCEAGALREVLHARSHGYAFREYQSTLAHFTRPTSSFDAYLESRYSRKARRRFRRDLKRFEARPDARLEVIETPEAARDLLERVYRLHGRTLDEASTFATPAQRAFHERLIPELASEGRLLGLALTAEGRDLAVEYGMRFRGRIYAFQSGNRPDDQTPSPGTLLQYLTLRDIVFTDDAPVYDFLDGDEAYKRRWCTGTRRLYDAEVDLRRAPGGVRGLGAALKTLVKEELKRRVGRGAPRRLAE